MKGPKSSSPSRTASRLALLRQARLTGWLLFALALLLRLLFWRATPDASWAWSSFYKGDAATWMAWAEALQAGVPFETGLPIRPPGAAYLIALIWNGEASGLVALQVAWCLIGALTVGLVYIAVLHAYGWAAATFVGLVCALSSGLMVLSTSLNNEAPYLLLVAGTLALWRPLWAGTRPLTILSWSALNALACLVRAEHLLYFALLLAVLAIRWDRLGAAAGAWRTLRPVALSALVFVALLTPWHLHAWSSIERFNHDELPADPGTEATQRRLERLVSYISWSPEALAELERLPAATRRTSRLFVTATEGVRGKSRVEVGSLGVLEEAFGSIPEPLTAHPYLVLYGPLNFFLANSPENRDGGFTRAPLERRPPLSGGIDRFPIALVQRLPPPDLTVTYPPHLEAIHHGYRLGWDWIRSDPGGFLRLAGRKLGNFWNGASLGLGGHNLPLGWSGTRRRVDLVVPDSRPVVLGWRLAVAFLVMAGAWVGRRDPSLLPWLGLLVTRVLVTVAFFGYARQGATVVPVVALLVWLALGAVADRRSAAQRSDVRSRGRRLIPVVAALALLAIELGRWSSPPEIIIDGRPAGAADPFVASDHRVRRIEVR